MTRSILYIIIFSFLFISCEKSSNPNVLIFMTDDQGWGDLSIHGNTNLKTPNIDSFSKNGASFSRFYVSPVCAPTRAELLTGKYFVRTGVNGVTRGFERMNTNEKIISNYFKERNYSTGLFGKWHNGSQPPYHPNSRGFDEFYGFTSGHWGNYFDPILERNGELVKGKGYINDDITNNAISFIKSSVKPFFTFISYNTPHSPMQVPDKYSKEKKVILKGRYSERENIEKTKAALGMIENIDENVGNIIKYLMEIGKYDDTIIIFLSDNGPNGNRWNNEFKERKGSTNEGGVRVPFFIQWPKKIKPGIKIKQVTSVLDVFPSLIDLIENTTNINFDGKSFKKYIENPDLFDNQRKVFSFWNNRLSVRNNEYILDYNNNLYDLKNDHSQYYAINETKVNEFEELKEAKRIWKELINEIIKQNKRRPFTVNYKNSNYTHLPARDAEITGILQRSSIHANCSFIDNWKNSDDYIYWDIDVLENGTKSVDLYYTLPKESVGTEIALEFEDQIIKKTIDDFHNPSLVGFDKDKIKRIESYTKDFKKINIGEMSFKKGISRLKLKTTSIKGNKSIDFRLLILKNKDEKNS